MSRPDCISNRNIKIIATYVNSRTGSYQSLFEGLPYPADEYASPQAFFLDEDEWTTYENFDQIIRRGKALVDEPWFYFNCGASSAKLRSWGRLSYFERVFATPSDGYKRLPFFNKTFNDTKEIEVILPPTYDSRLGKVRTFLKIEFLKGFDPNKDYIGDPYLRGMLVHIPTIWAMTPACVKQPLNPYDPEVLFNEEPEFVPLGLDVRLEKDHLTLRHPNTTGRCVVGERVFLEPELINGKEVYLGKYSKPAETASSNTSGKWEAILVTETVRWGGAILLKAGEIFRAPYFILDITYDRISLISRLSQIFRTSEPQKDSGTELMETINQLRKSIQAKNEAYRALEKTHAELREAKARLDEYSQKLEQKVEERTAELHQAQQNLIQLNTDLEAKVKRQVTELEKYNELRRYLSPKITEKILTGSHDFGAESQRKMMTVVFTDIRGFSTITESLEPEEIAHLLDRYLSEMIHIVHHHDGTLNKIVGDGLLVFFGDPVPMDDHAERAVRMAMDMQKKVTDLREEWLQYGHELAIGIGINTGYMTVGNIGSDVHRDYTVIGNQVNVAARLESIAQAGQILISQRTYSQVKNIVKVEEVGDVQVKGIHRPVKTHRVIC